MNMIVRKYISILILVLTAGSLWGQTYRIGDLFIAPDGSRGIVYYLHPDGTGGWVVALEDASTGCQWGEDLDIPGLNNIDYNYTAMMNDTAGYGNTQIIRTVQNNDSYAAGVVDFSNGWYLPSAAQSAILFGQLPAIAEALTEAGGTVPPNELYWSSTEYSSGSAWGVDFGFNYNAGGIGSSAKYGNRRVRAVRSFTYQTDVEVNYVWSTDDTTSDIRVTPTQTTTYTVTVSTPGGCSDTAQHIVVVNGLNSSDYYYTACDSYEWNGQIYTESDDYTYRFPVSDGCDSVVTLHLTVNHATYGDTVVTAYDSFTWHGVTYMETPDEAPIYVMNKGNVHGCDSIVVLSLTIYHSVVIQYDTTICEDDLPFEWGGVVFYEAETRIDSMHTFEGADSIGVWNLHVVGLPEITHSPDTAIVAGDSLTLWANGSDILVWTDSIGEPVGTGAIATIRPLTSGYYYITGYTSGENVSLTSSFYCSTMDSVWVEVLPNPDTMFLSDVACDYYVWYADTLTQSGVYYHTMTNGLGYDSVEVLTLTVNYGVESEVNVSICESELPYHYINGQIDTVFNAGTPEPSASNYYLLTEDGCDSIVTVYLSVFPVYRDTIHQNVCYGGSYLFNDTARTETGCYTQRLPSQFGCDSVTVLNLTVDDIIVATLDRSICFGSYFVFSGDTLTTPNTYYDTVKTAGGCDSVTVLNLTVEDIIVATIDRSICYGSYFVFGGDTLTTPNTYYDTAKTAGGCDSVTVLNLTVEDIIVATIDRSICYGSYFVFGGDTLTTPNTYYDTAKTAGGCDSVVTLHLTVQSTPSRSDTLIVYLSQLPYYFAPADTTLQLGSSDTVQFTYWAPAETGCDTMVAQTVYILEFQPLSVYATATINTQCDGDGCQYDGPTILINEVMLQPSEGDGSIVGDVLATPAEGEWIELYNPHKCQSVDISGYFLGNNAQDNAVDQSIVVNGNWGGGFALPPGTVVPAQGFCVVRGQQATPVPVNLLVENGGNTVEVIVNSRYCVDTAGRRLWFPNLGGWFAFYDAEGVPQDAIYWSDTSNFCHTCPPCTPTASDITFTGTLASFNGIPYSKKTYLGDNSVTGMSFRRVPDGGTWSTTPASATYGICNTTCVDPPVITCNGYAVAQAIGGVPPYTYLWDDTQAQTTDTAFQLCEGTYTVTVTDAVGETATAQVIVTDFHPEVSHPNAHFCSSESSGVLQGFPAGGTYEGAPMTDNTLVFLENVTEYQMTYTYTDANGCSASAPFQVTITPNTREMDTTICSAELPYLWYNQTLTASGTYQTTVPMDSLCDSLLTLHLTVIQQPQLVVDDDMIIESGQTVTLHASGANSYHWTPATGLVSPNSATPQASPTQSTMYYVTGYASDACTAMDSVAVLVYQHQDTTICENELPLTWYGITFEDTVTQTLTIPHENSLDEVIKLHVHTLPVFYSSQQFTVLENDLPFIFNGLSFIDDIDTTIIIPNSFGCDSVITLSLYVCRNRTTEVDSVVCENDLPLLWNGLSLNSADNYQAELYTYCGADSIVNLHLDVVEMSLSIVSLTPDFCEDFSADLMVVSDMPNYVWNTGETSPVITVISPGRYSVTAVSGDCRNTAYFNVENCETKLLLPNAITPSKGDGLNDYFSIPEHCVKSIDQFEIWIYNRWGELVYYSNDKNFRWNGECRGTIQYQTVYNYIIRYTSLTGKPEVVNGSVTVL